MAPVVAAVPAYAGLRAGHEPRVAAYLGVPLYNKDESIYGTLCAFGFRAQPHSLVRYLPLVELVGGLLTTILAMHSGGYTPQSRGQGHGHDST